MNVTEANDVNRVLRWLRGDTTGPGGSPLDPVDVLVSARRLADRANKTLMAGLTRDDITALPGPSAPLAAAARASLMPLNLLGDYIGNTFDPATAAPAQRIGTHAFDRCAIIKALKQAIAAAEGLPDWTAVGWS